MQHHYHNIAIIGSSGAIGSAFLKQLSQLQPQATIHTFSRSVSEYKNNNIKHYMMDYHDEDSIAHTASLASQNIQFDMILVTTGILHHDDVMPEKSLQDISTEKFNTIFSANTIFPALIAKYFLPHIVKSNRTLFAALSARVGSISDNHIGGWYAYRASKAALNMIIKNIAIEMSRRYKNAIIVGLHPGTVDSKLSKPFQGYVKEGKLFSPEYSVQQLLSVLDNLTPENSGKCFAWDGQEIKA